MKLFTKTLCVILRILKAVFLILIAVLLISTVVHQILTAVEKKKYPPIGDVVSVDGRNMSLFVMGSGVHTIVMTPGLGTTSPIYDFMPLAERLAKDNRVVIVESFGYGWSDATDKDRSVENTVEEMRSALSIAGIEAPYVLMPHSVSGLGALYYANKYPDEVEGVVGIDCTLPTMEEYFDEDAATHVSGLAGALCPMGIMRWITLASPNSFISDNSAGYYSEDNLKMQRLISGWCADNRDVIDQMNHVEQDMATTHDMAFSPELPVLFFTRDGSRQTPREDGKTSESFFETYITNDDCQQVIPLNGRHYLHWEDADAMAARTTAFLLRQLP